MEFMVKAKQNLYISDRYISSFKPANTPHAYNIPNYGKHNQCAEPSDDSPPLLPDWKYQIQTNVGSFLYYARAIDGSLLPALNEISASQPNSTESI